MQFCLPPMFKSAMVWAKPAFTPHPHSITTLRQVLISNSTEGRRLSWLEWMVTLDSMRWFSHWHRTSERLCPRGWLAKKMPLFRFLSPVTFKLRREFCTMHLTVKFRHAMLNRLEVIVRTNRRRWKHPPRSAILRCCVITDDMLTNSHPSQYEQGSTQSNYVVGTNDIITRQNQLCSCTAYIMSF